MKQPKRSISKLIKVVTKELYNVGYSKATVPRFELVWDELKEYSKTQNIRYFSEDLGSKFLKEFYNYPRVFEKKYPYNERIAVRAIRFIGDYQLYGMILKKRRDQQPEPPKEFMQAIREFLTYCLEERNNTQKTVELKVFMTNYFIEFLVSQNCKSYAEINREHILDFVKTLVVLHKRTFSRYGSCIRIFLNFLYKNRYIENELHIYLPRFYDTLERKLPTVWSRENIEKILKSVDRGNPTGRRDYAILMVVAKLGLRNIDVCNLKFENIDWDNNRIEFVQVKTGNLVVLPLFEDVGWAIIEYLKKGRPVTKVPYIFVGHNSPYGKLTSTYSILQKYLALAEIDTPLDRPHGMHALSHTFAVNCLKKWVLDGTDLNTALPILSKYLGHVGLNETQHYLRLTSELYPHIIKKVSIQFGDFIPTYYGGDEDDAY